MQNQYEQIHAFSSGVDRKHTEGFDLRVNNSLHNALESGMEENAGIDKIIEIVHAIHERDKHKQTLDLREKFAHRVYYVFIIWFLAVSLIICLSAIVRLDFKVPTEVQIGLLCTTSINIIGLLLIITRNLFPRHEKRE